MKRRWPPVLMYHAVDRLSADPNKVCVSPERFEAQMRHLKGLGLKGVSMGELLRAMESGEQHGLVGLTFDDGYENFLRYALPVLERFDFSATVFALSQMLGGENAWDDGPKMKLLGVEGLRESVERGMEVGSHGANHARLSGLKTELLRKEIVASRRALVEAIGEDVRGFCYPYGDLDIRAVGVARQAGYSYACAYKTRVSCDFYDIPRIHAGERDGPLRLSLKLKGFTRYADLLRSSR